MYSSIHIALGATLFTAESFWITGLELDLWYLLLVFSATLFIYSLHRIIGINKLREVEADGRFRVIRQHKNHIKFYTLISTVLMCWASYMAGLAVLSKMALVGLVSLAYVAPFFGKGKRLRDYNYIKIMLIAFVWAYIATLPLHGKLSTQLLLLLAVERFIFIFAITLPFDVRDFEIDKLSELLTIPKIIGERNTYKLCSILMAFGCCLLLLVDYLSEERCYSLIIITSIYILTYAAIQLTRGRKSDLFFSGLLDGTLVLRGIIVYCLTFLF